MKDSKENRRKAADELGRTSDEYSRQPEHDLNVEMSEGQDLGMTSPDVVTESPSGMPAPLPGRTDRGFADDRERRDR